MSDVDLIIGTVLAVVAFVAMAYISVSRRPSAEEVIDAWEREDAGQCQSPCWCGRASTHLHDGYEKWDND